MAVVRARNIHAKPEIWEHGCNNTPLLPSESVSTLNMSYQYIAPPPHDPAMDYNPGFRIVPQDSSAPEGDGRDSEGSYDDSPGTGLRRSFSTPNATQMQHHGASGQQAAAGASGEKKRNKLGYHRTSIACSHCRRRKIRCIASPDVQNRCVNCIRLKKECSFYPVDQQPGGESRSRGTVRQTAGSSVASSTSSPAVAGGSPREVPHPSVPGIMQGTKGQASGDDYLPPDVKVPSNGLPSSGQYAFGNQPHGTWISTDSNAASMIKSEGLNMGWSPYPAESPLSTQFSPFAPTSGSSGPWVPGTSEAGSHDDIAWTEFSQPVRSMSYSGESSAGHQQLQYMAIGDGQPFERRPSNLSGMYGQPFVSSATTISSSGIPVLDDHETILPATVSTDPDAWPQQHGLAQDPTQFRGWQYGKPTGDHQLWLDEQRQQTATTQAPSNPYYST